MSQPCHVVTEGEGRSSRSGQFVTSGTSRATPVSARTSRPWPRSPALQRLLESVGLPAATLDSAAGLDAFVGRVEAGFRGLFVENPQPMWVLDADTGRFVAVNRATASDGSVGHPSPDGRPGP